MILEIHFISCFAWFCTIWCGFEILFYAVLMKDWMKSFDILSPTPPYRMAPEELIRNILDDIAEIPGYDVKTFLEGWFRGTALADVMQGNVEDFLAWAMYNKNRANVAASETEAIARVLTEITRRFQITFSPGHNPDVACSNFTLAPAALHVLHRPLLFYVGVGVAKVLSHTLLFQAGFVPYQCGSVAYWYRPCVGRAPGSPEPLPLVFFHGISPGVFVYFALLKNLVAGRSALVVEMPHVGMGLDLSPPSRELTVKAVRRALVRHGIKRCCVVGHSYGSFCAAWMVHDCRDLVAQLVLLDPMCLLLHLPDVTYNFLYREPRSARERLLNYGAASEMGINNTLRRHFWWFNSTLFAHEIADIPTVVHLASNDGIAPAHHIARYLESHFAGRVHATMFGDEPYLKIPEQESEATRGVVDAAAAAAEAATTAETATAETAKAETATATSAGAAEEQEQELVPFPSPAESEPVVAPPSLPLSTLPRSTSSNSSSGGSVVSGTTATGSQKSPGAAWTLELIWSGGFSHGQVVLSPSRQREIAKRMFIQECRIFRDCDASKASSPASPPASPSSPPEPRRAFMRADSAPSSLMDPPTRRRVTRATYASFDEFDESEARLC